MRNLLLLLALVLMITWAIAFLAFHATGIIHLLGIISLISWLLAMIRKDGEKYNGIR